MNAVELSREAEERYRQYLKTTFYFRDPVLRESFDQGLRAVSRGLSKGPFLEATPVFKRGQTARGLFQGALGGRADEGFLKAVARDTVLYRHQEAAIMAVLEGRNVVLATGTGSGKTEAFLYPVLLHLYRESLEQALCPGVRALVLYPMNALANDQRQRFGEVGDRLEREGSPFRFTFGQYIGETPDNESDSGRHRNRSERAWPGELVLRSQMRQTPPHILLTNYSMLEYLLLRPDDSPLFDHGNAKWWTFLILDEAHQYRGSRGAEMAMLLRRLKRRLVEGGRVESFRCIATSATLAGGEQDKGAVARFAADLFGEEFREEDVILVGETEPIPEAGPARLEAQDYATLRALITQGLPRGQGPVPLLARKLSIEVDFKTDAKPIEVVRRLLRADGRSSELRRLISGGPVEVAAVANAVFADLSEERRIAALCELVDLMLKASEPAAHDPLLSARYHLFLRSLEGVFLSYLPEKRIVLDRNPEPGTALFEVALCRECGQHYLVGRVSGGFFREAARDPGDPEFKATFLRPLEGAEEGSEPEDEEEPSKVKVLKLCVRCGRIAAFEPDCGHGKWLRVREEPAPREGREDREDRADQMIRCSACGYNAGGHDPVREVVYGRDGPHAVIATSLYQGLPAHRRKVLAFADGRQDAAFFAWYLQESYENILKRNLLLKVARELSPESPEGLAPRDLATNLAEYRKREGLIRGPEETLELRQQTWTDVYSEFLAEQSRITLEGVGLARWALKWPRDARLPELLLYPPWSLTEAEARNLVALLLNFMRVDGAVELKTDKGALVNFHDLGLQKRQSSVVASEQGKLRGTERRWGGRGGRRFNFLCRLLETRGCGPEESRIHALSALRTAWETISQADRTANHPDGRLLLPAGDGRRLNPQWWRLHPLTADDSLFQCNACGRLHAVSVQGVCPRYRCPGVLIKVQRAGLESNHYRYLYEQDLPGPLRVEEHTAQLDYKKAREFQQEFRENKINVLSCSTTFELGVDLGDLDTVFLRNVPPEAFNYAQRVGRAGRRQEPGFAITYCGRGPHDLYHFSEPYRMLRGVAHPPILSLRNARIVGRHMVALVLSAFFRSNSTRFRTVKDLLEDLGAPTAVEHLGNFLRERRQDLEPSLRSIVPPGLTAELGIDNGTWIDLVAGDQSALSLAQAERSSDYGRALGVRERAKAQNDARTLAWANGRVQTLEKEPTLSFLSRKAVIPKYGFPVDVVELDTQSADPFGGAHGVSLQRDLSIAVAEFAPTSQVVANKRVWKSVGLKKVAEREWPRMKYYLCLKHNVFVRWARGEPEPKPPCGCELKPSEYIMPIFGFVTARDIPREPKRRPEKVFTTRPYFVGPEDPDPGSINLPAGLRLRKASPGTMVVLCEGRRRERFYVCGRCGAGFKSCPRGSHESPFGQECHGTLSRASLGHEFRTDVVKLKFREGPADGIPPLWFAYSLAYALVEGASEVMEVPSSDLSTAVDGRDCDPLPSIVIYDNVPGGAGLVARLEDQRIFKACLEAARNRVSGQCGCSEDASCYGCLRSYRNQFAHRHLQRGPVLHYLEDMLSRWP